MTAIRPAGHRVLVKPDPIDTKSAGGIILTVDPSKERAQIKGTLIAVGESAWKGFDNGSPWASAGDTIYYAQYAGFLIKDPATGEEFRLLNDEDICAVMGASDPLTRDAADAAFLENENAH